MTVAVLGAGSWGTTLAILLARKGTSVLLWAHRPEFARQLEKERENRAYLEGVAFPESLRIEADLERAVSEADVVVMAVPSQAMRQTAHAMAAVPMAGTIVVSVAKGIEVGTGKRMSEVLQEELPGLEAARIAVLYGPSHAEEVARQQPTTVVAASESSATAELVQELFHTSRFRVYVNHDVVGVEIAGSVKNIIAIAAGISDGIGFGDNAKAALITRGLAEMGRLSTSLGGDPMTISGLSGIGDLVVTCLSRHSRNRYVGEEIGRGRSLKEIIAGMNMVAEGVHTAKAIHELSRSLGVEMPISEAVYEMLFEAKPVEEAILDLMNRDPRHELD